MNITSAIAKITSGSNLTESEMSKVMLDLLEGKTTDAQIGAFLIALNMKGESVEEVLQRRYYSIGGMAVRPFQ